MTSVVNRFTIPTRDEVEPKAQALFDAVKKSIGLVPNLYAIVGKSANALESYVTFSNAQAHGTFNAKEREAIALAVSDTNGCTYCLIAHTYVGKLNGFSDDDIVKLRAGTIEDRKLGVLTRLAKSLVDNRGKANPALVEEFFALGYSEGALIDLVALVVDKTFSNYVGRLTNVPSDFANQ